MKNHNPGSGSARGREGDYRILSVGMTRIILWILAITIVSFILGLGILALSGGLSLDTGQRMSPFTTAGITVKNTTGVLLDGAGSGDVQISLGAGELTVIGGAPAGTLLEATVRSGDPGLQPDYHLSGNETKKVLVMKDTGQKTRRWMEVHSPNTWNIQLAGDVPLDLAVRLGAGDMRLDISSLNLTTLVVSTGAGETEIDLGGYKGGRFSARLDNGVGDITLRVPRQSNTRISAHQGVGDIENRGLVQQDDFYTTVMYNPAYPVNEILIEQGVGDIRLIAV